jgi:hypothetical protein
MAQRNAGRHVSTWLRMRNEVVVKQSQGKHAHPLLSKGMPNHMDSHMSRSLAVALVLAGAAGLLGCGSSSGGNQADGGSTSDSSTMEDGPTESGLADSAATDSASTDSSKADAGSDAAMVDCGKIPPTGTQILASTEPLVLQGGGLTSDGYAIYEDTNTQVLYAVDTAGGAPANLGPMTSQGGTFYLNGGKAVLFLPAPADPNSSIGALSAWSKASGPTVVSSHILAFDAYNSNYDVTQDGAYVVYYDFSGAHATLTISTIDGQTQRALVPEIDLGTNPYCLPVLQLVGNTLVAYYCLATQAPDSGVPAGALTIASFPVGSNFAAITQTTIANLAAPTNYISPAPVSPDGTKLLMSTAGIQLYPIAGGAPTTIDSNGASGGFTPAGDVVYVTQASELKRYSVADAGAPVTLDSSGVPYLRALSPDGNWIQTEHNAGANFSDIWIASTTTPNALTQAWTQTNALAFGFSADSMYETFVTNYPTNFGITTYDFYSSPVSGGTPQKILTTAGTLAFTAGSNIVVNTNVDKLTGAADIQSIDLSNPSAATTLVTQADPNFFYAYGPKKVVYTWYCAANSTAGIWTVAAP